MTTTKHRVRWYVYAGEQKIPRVSTMRGQWGYDAECSCGWETLAGGATERHIRDEIWFHKWSETSRA